MMKIFITGDYGMIGSMLKKALNERDDCEVVATIGDGTTNDLELIHQHEINISSPTFKDWLIDLNPDLIINCAGLVNTDRCEEFPFYASCVNEAAVMNIVRAMNELNSARMQPVHLLHFSTTAIFDPNDYGLDKPITNKTKIIPKTIYGISKYGGELVVKAYLDKRFWTIVRPCFIYDWPSHSVVAKMVDWFKIDIERAAKGKPLCEITNRNIYLDPDCFKDYMHVDDFTRGIMLLIFGGKYQGQKYDANSWAGQCFNISRGVPIRFQKIIEIFSHCGFRPDRYNLFPEGDYLQNHIVSGRMMKTFFPEWAPNITIEHGIKKMLAKAKII